jgi:Putative antitoxin of bacterial toxin-antitoxin system, YdaS/YdaT
MLDFCCKLRNYIEMINALEKYLKANNLSLESFGELLSVNKSTVLRWGQRRVPAERVLEIERATGISRHDLRPDIYPRNEAAA